MKVFEITFSADIKMDGNKQEIKLMVNDDKSLNAAIQMIITDPRAELVSVTPREI